MAGSSNASSRWLLQSPPQVIHRHSENRGIIERMRYILVFSFLLTILNVSEAQAPKYDYPLTEDKPYVYATLVVPEEKEGTWEDLLTPNARRVFYCESTLRPTAYSWDGGAQARGLCQITKKYHPTVTDEQAYDPSWCIQWSYTKSPKLWTCARMLGITNW